MNENTAKTTAAARALRIEVDAARQLNYAMVHNAVPLVQRIAVVNEGAATVEDLNRAFESGQLTSEGLIRMYLARIEAYDEAGPAINAILALNPRARETARALDAERRASGPRSPLHGMCVVRR